MHEELTGHLAKLLNFEMNRFWQRNKVGIEERCQHNDDAFRILCTGHMTGVAECVQDPIPYVTMRFKSICTDLLRIPGVEIGLLRHALDEMQESS